MQRTVWQPYALLLGGVAFGCFLSTTFRASSAPRQEAKLPVSEVVRTRQLEIIGDNGEVVAELKTTQGLPTLILRNGNGTPCFILATGPDRGAGLVLVDKAKPRLVLGLSEDGTPTIALVGKGNKQRILRP